jgi:hypothetical protein
MFFFFCLAYSNRLRAAKSTENESLIGKLNGEEHSIKKPLDKSSFG